MSDAEEADIDIITMVDENGVEQPFALLSIVEIDDQPYAVMAPVAQLEAEAEALDLYTFRYNELEDEVELDAVEDDDLVERIIALAEQEWMEAEEAEDAEYDDEE